MLSRFSNWRRLRRAQREAEAPLGQMMLIYELQLMARRSASVDEERELEELRTEALTRAEDVRWIQDQLLLAKATRFDVDTPEPKSERGDECWQLGAHTSRLYLRPAAAARIRREIRSEEERRRNRVTFWIGIIFGLLGLLVGLKSKG